MEWVEEKELVQIDEIMNEMVVTSVKSFVRSFVRPFDDGRSWGFDVKNVFELESIHNLIVWRELFHIAMPINGHDLCYNFN